MIAKTKRHKIALSVAVFAAGITFGATPHAQTTGLTQVIPVTFTGVVTSDVTNEIRIRDAVTGAYTLYTGPVPDYPMKKGDAVTFTFNAIVPTKAWFAPGSGYTGQIAADGIYKINVASSYYNGGGGFGGMGTSLNADFNVPTSEGSNFGQPTNTVMTLVYNANADSYSIDFSKPAVSGTWQVPGYTYDSRTNAFQPCFSNCAPMPEDNNLATFRLTENVVSAVNIGIFGTAPTNGPQSGNRTGLFDLLFSGSWNLPTYSATTSGGSTDVPEPGMILLFGAGAAALVARRRKALAKAA